jgi:hypothetical protein
LRLGRRLRGSRRFCVRDDHDHAGRRLATALLYLLVSRVKWIPRQWLVLAVLYGIAFLLVMNYVILPMSAIGVSIYKPESLPLNAFWHILLVGLPTAWFVTRALRSQPD